MPKAIVSVSNKRNLDQFCRSLVTDFGFELYSSGGTFRYLAEHGIPVQPVEVLTGNPEAFGGRMKTISFELLSGILFRRGEPQDCGQAAQLKIEPIDMVVCNLYPFWQVADKQGATEEELIENIDIGGPLMIRAAAKNSRDVTVVIDPEDYSVILESLRKGQGSLDTNIRQYLALKVWRFMGWYDGNIFGHLLNTWSTSQANQFELFSHQLPLALTQQQILRYGENPHQKAAWYRSSFSSLDPRIQLEMVQGKELSYNNLLDIDAAWSLLTDLRQAFPQHFGAVVIKHTIPCGLACSLQLEEAFSQAWHHDPISRFGGIIGFSDKVTREIAQQLMEVFIEVVIAPDFEPEALAVFATKPSVRVVRVPFDPLVVPRWQMRSFFAGFLVQEQDQLMAPSFTSVTMKRFPDNLHDLARFGEIVVKHLKSNALCLVDRLSSGNGWKLLAFGSGQPNRVDVLRLLMAPRLKDQQTMEPVMVSEAFFPFPDIIEEMARLGLQYVVQPGGSRQDQAVIDRANELGIAMAFSQVRHFRHG